MTPYSMRALVFRISLLISLVAASAHAAEDIWQTGSNNFWTAGDWSLGHPPTSTDSATFNQAATYNVYFDGGDGTASSFAVVAGDVSFRLFSGQTTRILNVTDTSVVSSNATLRLDHIFLDLNGALLFLNGTLNASSSSVSDGQSIAVETGSLIVDGPTSFVYAIASRSDWGYFGGQATVTFSNGASGTFADIDMAYSTIPGTSANVMIQTGAHLNSSALTLATKGGTATATFSVQGSGSTITQSGASTLVVGHSTSGSATINIGTTTGGAVFTTGTGQTTINKTGKINIGTGTFNAHGNVTIDGGTLDDSALGSFTMDAGKIMTVQNGGRATINRGYTTPSNALYNIVGGGSTLQFAAPTFDGLSIAQNAVVNVNTAASLLVNSFGSILDVGSGSLGTLNVDGNGSRVAVDPNSGRSFWGDFGGQANITFSGGATGTFWQVDMAASSNPGTNCNANIQTGAHLYTGSLTLAASGGSTTNATLNVQGSGSSVTQSGTSPLLVGHSTTGTATLNIGTTSSGAVFTTGLGSTIINKTGTVIVGGTSTTGSLIANGNVMIDGGKLQVGPGSGVLLAGGTFLMLSNAGTLKGSGNIFGEVVNGGVVAPGLSPGTLPISGNYTQNSTGVLQIELSSAASYDRLLVNGKASLGGTLAVSLIDGFVPVAGNSFDILDWGTRSGTFATPNLPPLPGGLQWNTLQLYTSGILSVSIPGDFNLNGKVDAGDYVVWRKYAGSQTDYNLWRSHFGQTVGSGSGQSVGAEGTMVPEPITIVTLLAGFILISVRRQAAR
jgi:hypothetical protein